MSANDIEMERSTCRRHAKKEGQEVILALIVAVGWGGLSRRGR